MKKKNSTKKALLTSVLSLLLCASMLVGTTFAWFTDSVSTGVNTIASGNLDVDVFYGDPALKQSIEGIDTLFNDVKLWEPGAVAYENLTVANLGSLALKYTVGVAFTGENYILENGQPVYSLPDILQVGLVPGGVDESLSREAIVASVNEWFPMETYVWEDELLAQTNAETMGVVIWWEPSASDNNWNVQNGKQTDDGADHLHVDLGITLAATQLVHENDSFDNTYDQTAKLPMVAGGTLNVGAVTVVVPENAPAGDYELKVNKFDLVLDTNHDAVLDADFAVLKDGVAVTPGQLEYEVQLQLDIMAKDFVVTHNGNPISEYAYDVFTGLLTFTTDSFSPFGVTYKIFGKDVAVEGRKILRGFFSKGVDPRRVDTTLVDSSEYMTVHFQKDGQDIWSVSKTADTLFIGKTAGTYTDANGNEHAITVETGNLYKIISDLTANDHNTLYILPGTYNEGTTIYVYSSMDIVGLGDTGTVKLVKTSSSDKNRHLLNVTGSKADYVQVTIRNLDLDATANTTGGKDNAAVQSIRKSKVKCYDLTITKATNNWSSCAFYVNGNNAVDGVKYPAYLYAEDCTVTAFGVGTYSGSYKFFHAGVTNKGNAFTTNSSSVKNIVMPSNDWDWTK